MIKDRIKKIYQRSVKNQFLLFLASIPFLFSECSALKIENVCFNTQKNFFEYKVNNFCYIPLRNDSLHLVDSVNYESFLKQCASQKFQYPFNRRTEDNQFIIFNDRALTKMYALVQHAIQTQDYAMALSGIHVLRFGYADINY